MSDSHVEEYLKKLNGQDVDISFEPQSNVELYLAKMNGMNVQLPPEPESRVEALLADYIESGGGDTAPSITRITTAFRNFDSAQYMNTYGIDALTSYSFVPIVNYFVSLGTTENEAKICTAILALISCLTDCEHLRTQQLQQYVMNFKSVVSDNVIDGYLESIRGFIKTSDIAWTYLCGAGDAPICAELADVIIYTASLSINDT